MIIYTMTLWILRYIYIEIYHFIIEIIFKVNSISESSHNKLNNSCNRFSFRKAEFYNKADDESSNKKHFDLYYILISQKLSIF